MTVNNLSAPYTVDCDGAYIEVERERDGFEARWCGNRIKQVSGDWPQPYLHLSVKGLLYSTLLEVVRASRQIVLRLNGNRGIGAS